MFLTRKVYYWWILCFVFIWEFVHFSFIFEGLFCWTWNSRWQSFSLNTLNILFHYFWLLWFLMRYWLLIIPFTWSIISVLHLQDYPFVFWQFDYDMSRSWFLWVYSTGSWSSWMCRLIFFTNWEGFPFPQIYFPPFFLSPLFWNFHYVYPVCLMVSCEYLRLCSLFLILFSFCFSYRIISVDLS